MNTINRNQIEQSPSGIYLYKGRVLRTDDKKLVQNGATLEKILKNKTSDKQLFAKNELNYCNYFSAFKVSQDLTKVNELLKKGKTFEAQKRLEVIKKNCPDIGYQSVYHLLLAKTYEQQKKMDKAKFEINNFLKSSESFNIRYGQKLDERMKNFKYDPQFERTRRALSTGMLKASDINIDSHIFNPKMFSLPLLPGGAFNRTSKPLITISSNSYQSTIGLGYLMGSEYGHFFPLYSINSESENIFSISHKYQFYESENSDFQIGISSEWSQIKEVVYKSSNGYIFNQKTLAQGNYYSFAIGSTKRISPFDFLALSGEIRYSFYDIWDLNKLYYSTFFTLFTPYYLNFSGGIKNSDPFVGLQLLGGYVYIDYNFEMSEVISGVGLAF
ncbi:MAG: hypothetical protein H6622_08735 [Halobacteriovoraceae bacterium]|nr:hypothetical protein [Halobacteriovoraceae bacterium]